jgi:hypothetical protein
MPGLMSGSQQPSLAALLKLGESARAMATPNTAQSPEPPAMATAEQQLGSPPTHIMGLPQAALLGASVLQSAKTGRWRSSPGLPPTAGSGF